jgi:hypothetical protein
MALSRPIVTASPAPGTLPPGQLAGSDQRDQCAADAEDRAGIIILE